MAGKLHISCVWYQDTFIFGAEDGWWDLLFQTWQIFLRSFDVPTNDLFLVVARWYAISELEVAT